MESLDLFPKGEVVGVFRGFREGGLEFHAELVLPYRSDFHRIPMHGQFLLVQLETPEEAVLGRITSFSSDGRLSSPSGEEFNIRAMREHHPVPDDLREDYLRYRVNIRILGVLRSNGGGRLTFVASHRRLPHLGSPVAFPSAKVLQDIAGHNVDGAEIGYFALGEYVYGHPGEYLASQDWMQFKAPEVAVKFAVGSLVSRRSFIFARAGFGKSNLNKLLFAKLYEETPTVEKRQGRKVPVGTVIFDPDGEYFWPDDKGRPGLADVPALEDKLVVFTSRHSPSSFYQSFVASGIKLDIRRLRPADVIAIAIGPDRQDQQNVRKLAGLRHDQWQQLVNLIDEQRNQADLHLISDILGLEARQDAEALAARSNMTRVVAMLHDKSSSFMDMLLDALSHGKLCVVDLSQMRGGQSQVLAGLILRRIFDHNQEEFTKAASKTIPTIAVIEEAQAVLNDRSSSAEPYLAWVKEGRKYDLGAVLVTQQPGSIPPEILSQGDNWFIFHLLSAVDLGNVQRANAHFSDDLLSVLLNEPIPGHGVFWSSVSGTPYPVPLRVFSFEQMVAMRDPHDKEPAAATYGSKLRRRFDQTLRDGPHVEELVANGKASVGLGERAATALVMDPEDDRDQERVDRLELMKRRAIRGLKGDAQTMRMLHDKGVMWFILKVALKRHLPDVIPEQERDDMAYNLIREALDSVLGEGGWHTFRENTKLYAKAGKP